MSPSAAPVEISRHVTNCFNKGTSEADASAEQDFFQGNGIRSGAAQAHPGEGHIELEQKVTMWFGYAIAVSNTLPMLFMCWPR